MRSKLHYNLSNSARIWQLRITWTFWHYGIMIVHHQKCHSNVLRSVCRSYCYRRTRLSCWWKKNCWTVMIGKGCHWPRGTNIIKGTIWNTFLSERNLCWWFNIWSFYTVKFIKSSIFNMINKMTKHNINLII